MTKEKKAMLLLTITAGVVVMCIHYLNEFRYFLQINFVFRIFIVGIIGLVLYLICAGIAYLFDITVKGEKEDIYPSFWTYAVTQPQKGKGRRAIAVSLVVGGVVFLNEFGMHLHLAVRILIVLIIALNVGLFIEYLVDNNRKTKKQNINSM